MSNSAIHVVDFLGLVLYTLGMWSLNCSVLCCIKLYEVPNQLMDAPTKDVSSVVFM